MIHLMINMLYKLTESNARFMLVLFFFICLWSSCDKQDGIDCTGGGYNSKDLYFNYDIGALTDSSLLIFPNNLPTSSTFKNNFNNVNILGKSDLIVGKKTWTYYTEKIKTPCNEYQNIYTKSVSHQTVELIPINQPNFYHRYSRTRYIEYQNYQNYNPKIMLDNTYEIITVTLVSPLSGYTFILPVGDVSKKLTNYIYYDTITISGFLFNNIYHIYADSANYDANKVVPQGLYYHQNDGLVGYYLSSGELWTKQ